MCGKIHQRKLRPLARSLLCEGGGYLRLNLSHNVTGVLRAC